MLAFSQLLRDGEGMIRLFWRVAMPSAGSKTDTVQVVSFENLHAPVTSGYLVNALVDSLTVPIVGTRRSWSQQQFALSVLINAPQSAAMAAGSLAAGTTRWARWLRVVPGFVRHGMYHVATGFDHVVFVIALLLGGGRSSSAPQRPPIGRYIQPAEVAALTAFLLSEQAASITGQDIAVCVF